MTDRSRDEREPETPVADLIDGAVRRLATSFTIAGALIALAIYARPGPPRYEAFATPGGFVRIDTRTGKMIGCEAGRCMTVLQRGQRLAPNPNRIGDRSDEDEPESAPPPSQKALPVPKSAPAPSQPANPSAAPAPARPADPKAAPAPAT